MAFTARSTSFISEAPVAIIIGFFFSPIYFVIKIFEEINLEYENYVKLVYNTNDEKTIPFYNNDKTI
jgi:hypothetical protein